MSERALLVHVDFTKASDNEDLAEFQALADAAGAQTLETITVRRERVDVRYLIGKGKVEELVQKVTEQKADLVIVNHSLSPSQERNLERELKCRVIDRTGLILDIFAQRAQSFEGKLQVELAQLNHLASRLVRTWTHLERQKGGIGLRGPGEAQLETDRRLIRQRIKTLLSRLAKIKAQRSASRKSRSKSALPTVSLVGYTNAGKSTLFNTLANDEVYVADQLFATLDPTLRRIQIPGVGDVILVDTVGFVQHLPHQLIEAFSATLEETRDADLLLHVIDVSDPRRDEKITHVNDVLAQIDADQVLQIQVFNKIDLLEEAQALTSEQVGICAQTGQGLVVLEQAIARALASELIKCQLSLSADMGGIRAQLYETQAILQEQAREEGGWIVTVQLHRDVLRHILRKAGIAFEDVQVIR
ncbi:MAG: ribosome rescue GTPase HflX [Taibaiella sp.]